MDVGCKRFVVPDGEIIFLRELHFLVASRGRLSYDRFMKANVISIQDAYIATVSSVAESNYNYCAVVAKAWSKACKALAEIGWTGAAADSRDV